MKVYAVYVDWGAHSGCKPPYAAFSKKADAALWIFESAKYWKDNAKIIELTVDEPPELDPDSSEPPK